MKYLEINFLEFPLCCSGLIENSEVILKELKDDIIIIEASEKFDDDVNISIFLFDPSSFNYVKFEFNNCKNVDIKVNQFSNILSYKITNKELLKKFKSGISNLQELKKGDFSVLEDKCKPYPKECENKYSNSFEEQIRNFFDIELTQEMGNKFEELSYNFELAFLVNNSELYNKFIEESCEDYINYVLKSRNLENHKLFKNKVTRFYIGNEFCHYLFPNSNQLNRILDKINTSNYEVSIVLPFIRESVLEIFYEVLDSINNWSVTNNKVIEIIVNDIGVLGKINTGGYENLKPVLGRLLNKRKKDPRTEWKIGVKEYYSELMENSLNSKNYQNFLMNYGISRYEFETTPIDNKIPGNGHSIHFPFYQIATSAYCHLYAECKYLYPTSQVSLDTCPQLCKEFYQQYPIHLKTIGRGNTVFGINENILTNSEGLDNYFKQGVDRIIFDAHL